MKQDTRDARDFLTDQDIAGFLEEHSARVSDDERRAIDEAVSVSVAQKLRYNLEMRLFLDLGASISSTRRRKKQRHAVCSTSMHPAPEKLFAPASNVS